MLPRALWRYGLRLRPRDLRRPFRLSPGPSFEDFLRLFLSVGWASGRYPDKLVRGLDDGATVALLHYLLVDPAYQGLHIGEGLMERILDRLQGLLYVKIMPSDPKTVLFYERFGFRQYDNYTAMSLKRFG